LIVNGDEKDPLRVRLEPWGTLTGRLVTAGGESFPGVASLLTSSSRIKGKYFVAHSDITSPLSKEGRFRIEGLMPGLTYELQVGKQGYAVDIVSGKSKDLTIKAGETLDLGVVKVKVKE
jgi:hypothetical protein